MFRRELRAKRDSFCRWMFLSFVNVYLCGADLLVL